ncbi:MbtH family NRPS accessory protein [Amycolatopsis sp., V23-08]|uniref:MbtH family NRPS accessory protein n=1 Tax=Amycolatopsis heterodermiae TaxID=3110235 RepID=A0ABU5R2F9_9PSEU|nr:MbtH family NRPS accessory protein [Amycolatopsis sp., V23-08]MEA5360348.1 MbtH family NRPS accessory protein [Amycolatopsis sp., V23-08]
MTGTEARAPHYTVVRNEEDQYSVWPLAREIPPGWAASDFVGTRDECLDHVERVWTDPRPRSVRAAMREPARD